MPRNQTLARRTTGLSHERGKLSAGALASAIEQQRLIFETTGQWLRVGDILGLREDLSAQVVQELRGSALLPADGSTTPEAEFYGEIALRRGLVTPEQFLECLEIQAADRRERRPHRLIGSILVEKGHLKPVQIEQCALELRRDVKLHHAASKRSTELPGEKPVLSPIDAQYIRAGRHGELPPEEIMSAVGRAKALQKVLGRRISIWEVLVVRGIVPLEMHKRLLERSCNVRSARHGSWMLGGILVELGYATASQVAEALEARASEAVESGLPPRRLGEILVERRVLGPAELEEALRVQAHRREASRKPTVIERARRAIGSRAAAIFAALLLAGGAAFAWGPLRDRQARMVLADAGATLEARLAALDRLAADHGEAAVRAIAGAARDRVAPPALRAACVRALARTPGDPARDAIRDALGEGPAALRATAAWAIGDRGDAAMRPALRERLGDPSESVRVAAARALALFREGDGREALVGALDPERPERRGVAADVGRPADEVACEIARALETLSGFRLGTAHERWALWLSLEPVADELCGRQRGPGVVARFAVLLESRRLAVRFGAARALAHLGDPRGAALLTRALEGDGPFREALLAERGLDVERIRDEIVALLSLLTGQSLGPDGPAWRAWLETHDLAAAPASAARETGPEPRRR